MPHKMTHLFYHPHHFGVWLQSKFANGVINAHGRIEFRLLQKTSCSNVLWQKLAIAVTLYVMNTSHRVEYLTPFVSLTLGR